MVAAGQEVDAASVEVSGRLLGNAEATGCIFTIGNHQINHVTVHQSMQFVRKRLASRLSDHITYKQELNGHIQWLVFLE